MTGSPVTKSPMDLWGQLCFLGVEQDFATNYYSFRARYCTLVDLRVGLAKPGGASSGRRDAPPKSRTVKKITGYQNLDRLERLLSRHSHRVLKSKCLDLPPKIYETSSVPLTDEQERLYRQMTRVATAEIAEGVWSTARNAIGRLQKLHQIILGHLVDEEGVVYGINTNRPRMVCDLIEEAGDKVIVWCAYRRDVTLVLQELGRRFPDRLAVRYDGECPPDQRPINRSLFQDGNASFFVGTAATGGIGLTLTASATTIYYSNSFSLLHRIQSEDRNHRDGQRRSVTYVDMMSPGTVEERIVRVLRDRKDMAEAVMGDGARDWLEWLRD
jgi:SNF2 family DNA or RNA helicase